MARAEPAEVRRSRASEADGAEVRSEACAAIRERREGVGEKGERAGRRCRAAACAGRDPGEWSPAWGLSDDSPEAAKSAQAEPSPSRSDRDAAGAERSDRAPHAQRVARRIPALAGVGALRGFPAERGSERR